MKYHFIFYKEKDGYWAEGIELPSCQTQGDSLNQLKENLQEALDLFLSEPMSSSYLFPKSLKTAPERRNILEIRVSPSVAFAVSLRELRLKARLTQVAMKGVLGIKALSNYQRLEDPEKANPELKTLVLIKSHFPHFAIDDIID